jgi:serine/threonine protein kinase
MIDLILEVGLNIKDFTLVKRMPPGSLSEIWLAQGTFQKTTYDVVLKIYTKSLDPQYVDTFINDFTLAKSISHPNILSPLWMTSHRIPPSLDYPVIVMDYYPGGDIEKLKGKISNADLQRFLLQISGAIEYLHSKEIAHRDLKPGNILIDEKNSRYLITDFGISYQLKQTVSKNAPHVLNYTTHPYAAPHNKKIEDIYDLRPLTSNDMFSLGVMLFELITGKLPNEGTNYNYFYEFIEAFNEPPHLPSSLRNKFENLDEIDKLIQECWQLDYLKRPSAQVFKERIELIYNKGRKTYREDEEDMIIEIRRFLEQKISYDEDDKNKLYNTIRSKGINVTRILFDATFKQQEELFGDEKKQKEMKKEEAFFLLALQIGTKEALENYTKTYPDGHFIKEAYFKLKDFDIKQEREFLDKRLEIGTIDAIQHYLDTYAPKPRFEEEARKAIKNLQQRAEVKNKEKEEKAWNQALIQKTRDGFIDFVNNYPYSIHIKEANNYIEDYDWRDARQNQQDKKLLRRDLKAYADKYLNGRYYNEAKKLIDNLEHFLRRAEAMYCEARDKNEANFYIKFINTYENELCFKEELTYCEKRLDELEWIEACRINSVERYEEYRKKPGKYIQEAYEKINLLKKEKEKRALIEWKETPPEAKDIRWLKNFNLTYPDTDPIAEAMKLLGQLIHTRNIRILKKSTLIILSTIIIFFSLLIILPTEKKSLRKARSRNTIEAYYGFLTRYDHKDSCNYCRIAKDSLKHRMQESLFSKVRLLDSMNIQAKQLYDSCEIDSFIENRNVYVNKMQEIYSCYCPSIWITPRRSIIIIYDTLDYFKKENHDLILKMDEILNTRIFYKIIDVNISNTQKNKINTILSENNGLFQTKEESNKRFNQDCYK